MLIFDDDSEVTIDVSIHINDALEQIKKQYDPDLGGDIFSTDNRAGIPGTLHLISCIRNRRSQISGLTYRVGRHIENSSGILRDIISEISHKIEGHNQSVLILGPPGIGKTTLLRDMTIKLANEFQQRVVVVDTLDEVGGVSDVAHPCLGRARRMSVLNRARQHEVLIEAIQNHAPQIIVIDEISTKKEVEALRTISQRGIAVVAALHGSSLPSLLTNHDLAPLLGGIKNGINQGDHNGSKKSPQLERKTRPVFGVIVEVIGKSHFRIYKNVIDVIDSILSKQPYTAEERWLDDFQYMARFCSFSSNQIM